MDLQQLDSFALNTITSAVRSALEVEAVVRPYASLVSGVSSTLFIGAIYNNSLYGTKFWISVLLLCLLVGPGFYYGSGLIALFLGHHSINLPDVYSKSFMLGFPVGVLLVLLWWRYGAPLIKRIAKRFTRRSSSQRMGRTDVKNITEYLPKSRKDYDPLKFIDQNSRELKKCGFFVGLNECGRPVRIPYVEVMNSHIAVSGATRSGKGVFIMLLLYQHIINEECVVVLDPKGDVFAPLVLRLATEKADVPFYYVNLNAGFHPQINILNGASYEDIINLFISGFKLNDTGDMADHHRNRDRLTVEAAARIVSDSKSEMTFRDLYTQMMKAGMLDDVEGFAMQLKSLANLAPVNAKNGINLKSLVGEGGCIYFVGDVVNQDVAKMQRMIVMRIMQLAKERDQTKDQRPVAMFMDEVKYLISRPAIALFGVACGFGLHAYLAFQSLQDLRDCPADLDPQSIIGGLLGNAGIKVCYRSQDPDSADWFSRLSGTTQVDDEFRSIDRNLGLSESIEADRRLSVADTYLIDANKLLYLPKKWGVLFGIGIPNYIYVCPIRVRKEAIPVFRPVDEAVQRQTKSPVGVEALIDVN